LICKNQILTKTLIFVIIPLLQNGGMYRGVAQPVACLFRVQITDCERKNSKNAESP